MIVWPPHGVRAHRVNVAEGVRGGNRAVIVGIVDERRKEIDGQDNGLRVTNPIDGGIVGRGEPHEEVWVMAVLEFREMAEYLREHIGAGFGSAAGA